MIAALGLNWLDLELVASQMGISIKRHSPWGRDLAKQFSAGRLVPEGTTAFAYDNPNLPCVAR
ncbi:MAG: hypothetical protein NVS3B5_02470 [Sphingomicrobium sp.]